MNRCINLDWLEVYCLEPADAYGFGVIDAEFLRNRGWSVKARDYGTPAYKEVLFLAPADRTDRPIFEVRRVPRESSDGSTFMHRASCHIRITNMYCYAPFPIIGLTNFLRDTGYHFQSIKRVDIALDFNRFDSGEDPADFLNAYINGRVSKINQSRVSAHGADDWDGRRWNSFKWGSPSSNITTKIYNKTMELKQVKMKSYIQDAWKDAGLKLDAPVWRVEFSIKAGQRGFKNKQTQEFYKMQLSSFDSRSKLLFIFHCLADKYFHFKYREFNPDGTAKRKDRCRDKMLFKVGILEKIFEPTSWTGAKDPSRMDRVFMKKCWKIHDDDNIDCFTQDAAFVLAEFFQKKINGYIV